MRDARRDRRNEAFYVRRASNGGYVPTSGGGLGAGARKLLFDIASSTFVDNTDNKIACITNTAFTLTAREQETWCVQLTVAIVGAISGANYVCPALFGPGSSFRNLAILTAVATNAHYQVTGEIILSLNPGETIEPGINSDNATNNNPSSTCIFSGYRIA